MKSWRERYAAWWFDDLPSMHGALRAFVYLALLLLAYKSLKSPLMGVGFYEATDARLVRAYGSYEWLGVPYIDPAWLKALAWATAGAWLCAGIGLGTRVASVVTAVGCLLLYGMYFGTNAFNHYWFLPVYAFLALCFARSRDAWSVDSCLRRRWGRSNAEVSVIDTGFARKLVLLAAVAFYFAAGVSKVATAGWVWADGHTVHYFALTRGTDYPLAPFLGARPGLCTLLGAGTLVLEVGAPLALFSRHLRHFFVFGWIGMHVGIRYGMGPAYWPNVVVLMLLIDWSWLATVAWGFVRRNLRPLWGKRNDRRNGAAPPRGTSAALWGGTLAMVVAFIPGVFQVTWYPLTSVYMYSAYFSASSDIRANHPRADFADAEALQAIARSMRDTGINREATEYLCYRAGLRLVRDDAPADTLWLFDGLGTVDWKQWVLAVAGPVLIDDLVAKPDGRIAFDPATPDTPGQRFLSWYVDVIRDRADADTLRRYDRLELVTILSDTPDAARPPMEDAVPDAFWEHNLVEITPRPGARAVALASVRLHD